MIAFALMAEGKVSVLIVVISTERAEGGAIPANQGEYQFEPLLP